jgi:hypothetical protein
MNTRIILCLVVLILALAVIGLFVPAQPEELYSIVSQVVTDYSPTCGPGLLAEPGLCYFIGKSRVSKRKGSIFTMETDAPKPGWFG